MSVNNALNPLHGTHTKLVSVQGATVDISTGLWTLDTTLGASGVVTLGLYVDELAHQNEVESERVEGYTTAVMNEVGLVYGARLQLAEIMRVASPQSFLEAIMYLGCTHIVLTERMRKTNVVTDTYRERKFWLHVSGHGWGRGRFKNVYRMECATVDIGSPNPLITT